MNSLKLSLLLFYLVLISCSDSSNPSDPGINPETPIVQENPVYDVTQTSGIIYAQGLSHESLNSDESQAIDLLLDVYVPDNELDNRPVIMLIHGGGFIGGSRTAGAMVNLAQYFASRGWVAFSIDYRLLDEYGTIPQEWLNYNPFLEPQLVPQFNAIYPAHRDAKAAMRWIIANANTYRINTNYITVGGGSAGAITATALGISDPEDFRDEIDAQTDPTLLNTNLSETFEIKTILDFWGSKVSLDAIELIYNKARFDSEDPALFIAHGTEDPTVVFEEAEALRDAYITTGAPYVFYALEGAGHGAWSFTVNGKSLEELAYDFVVEQQELVIE